MEKYQNIENERWHRTQTLILIRELQKYKCLYDPLDDNFINKPMRSKKLNLIRDKLKNIKPNVTVDQIKKKIKSLKNQLWKEEQKVINSKKSGSGANEVYEPILWCYKELLFLLYANGAEPGQSNFDLVELRTDTEESNDNLEDSGSGITPEKKRKKQAKQLEECGMGANKFIKQFMKQNFENTPVKQPLEKEEQFCQYLSSLLKKIKSEETFEDLSLQIITLVNQNLSEEMNQLQASNYLPPIQNSPSFTNPSMLSSTSSSISIPTSFRKTPSSKPNNSPLEFRCQSYIACSSRSSPDISPSSPTSSTNKRKSTQQIICNHRLCIEKN